MNQRVKSRRSIDLEVHNHMEILSNQLLIKQLELEESHSRYVDLYDHAPVGYLTLNKSGKILSINLTGAMLLKTRRSRLIEKFFVNCFTKIDQRSFEIFLQNTFAAIGKMSIDLKVGDIDDDLSYLRLESTAIQNTDMCRMMMSDISQLKKVIMLNRDLLAENRRLMKELFRIQEKERRILARELHDALSQWLTAIRAENEVIFNYCNNCEKESLVHSSAQVIKSCTDSMHQVIRGMLHRLRPILLDSLGLPDALSELRKEYSLHHARITLKFELSDNLISLGETFNINIFRLIQEGLNNAYKHAKATQIDVSLNREAIDNSAVDFLTLDIKDNGVGFDPNTFSTGFGLVGMRERVITLDGRMNINSSDNQGTEINIRLPFPK